MAAIHALVMSEAPGPTRPGPVPQSVEPLGQEAASPHRDLVLVDPDLIGHAPQRHALRAQQDDPRPARHPHRRGVTVHSPLQLRFRLSIQLDQLDGEHGASKARFTTPNHKHVTSAGMH